MLELSQPPPNAFTSTDVTCYFDVADSQAKSTHLGSSQRDRPRAPWTSGRTVAPPSTSGRGVPTRTWRRAAAARSATVPGCVVAASDCGR